MKKFERISEGRRWLARAALFIIAVGAGLAAWYWLQPKGLPKGFAASNGRIEAVEIDIASKTSGRIKDIFVDEGDFVTAGKILAKMDTAVLEAQLLEAQAQLQRAQIGIETAKSQVTQREAEREAAVAVIAQREAELDAAQKRLTRTAELERRGNASVQVLDDDRARFEGMKAAVNASRAQLAATEAAIGAAKSQVIDAQAAVEVVRATIQRIQADIDDSVLISPRDGRVQYRIAQPGEVLSPGGRVLNLVDLTDVYMTFFLPTASAGRVAIGTDVRLVFDAAPQYVVPAKATFVADVAQFTPKTVETAEERQKLMFRIKARIDPEVLRKYVRQVKTGLPGMAYVRLDPRVDWPPELQVNLPQ